MVKPVLLVLGASALPLATRLKEPLGAEIHTPSCVAGGDIRYSKATQHLGALFTEGRSIIGLCAAGILIRAIAPHIKDKRSEPPVIALAEDGSSAVPLLGGIMAPMRWHARSRSFARAMPPSPRPAKCASALRLMIPRQASRWPIRST